MMRSSSRNQRCKKLKMKHALQLVVLLIISIWLLYQLKHTFDKKYSVDATTDNIEENPITANDQIIPEKTTKLGRKDLPQYIENRNSNSERENEVDEDDEERDAELDQLLEDVEARENSQDDAEGNGDDRDDETVDGEYNTNGEEDEEGNIDADANGDTIEMEEKAALPSVNASIAVQSDSASNQTVTVNLSINPENNTTTNVDVKEDVGKLGVQDGLHAIQESSVQAKTETSTDAPPYLSTKVEGNMDEIKEG